jgi:hypothetical protein
MLIFMNKFWAIIFALATFALFGLGKQDSRSVQDRTKYGTPTGPVRTVHIAEEDRIGYRILGVVSAVACLFFVARIRRDDLRR